MYKISVSDYIIDFLVKKNVKHVFGYQGGAILKILTSMNNRIDYVQNFNEQASSYCADAYARINGELGVAVATSGPGATNLISGIVNAYYDSVPTMFITGQDFSCNLSDNPNIRSNGFQDLNFAQIAKNFTKYCVRINNPKDIRYELEKAYHYAICGRKGPVLLEIPIDVQFIEIEPDRLNSFIPPVEPKPKYDLDKVIRLIKNSKRPVVLAGGGIRTAKAIGELTKFVNKSSVPLVTTLNGLDVYSDSYGFSGLHGNTFSNLAVNNADLILAIGSRLGKQQVGKSKNEYTKAKIIHVDIDNNELNRALIEEISILADANEFLKAINDKIKNETFDFTNWQNTLKIWHQKYKNNTYINSDSFDPVIFIEKLSDLFEPDAIITTDVGQNQLWAAQAINVKKDQRFLTSSGFGAMGYSLPAAIGAAIAQPQKQIISLMGDGGFQMNLQELELILLRKLNIKCFIFNNQTLGKIKEMQIKHFPNIFIGTEKKHFACPNLKMIAKAYSLKYLKIEGYNDIKKIPTLLSKKKACLFEVLLRSDSKLLNRHDEADIYERERIND